MLAIEHQSCKMVGRVGLEPTKPKAADLQSAVIATIRPTHNGGGLGIRTPGPFRVNGFQDRRFQPLSQTSINNKKK